MEEYPVNLRVEMAPNGSTVLLPGSVTITHTTVSVFKLCELNDEEPLFIGICSIPLMKVARVPSVLFAGSEAVVLTSVSDHLFINASLSAGLATQKEGSATSRRTASTGLFPGTPKEEPAAAAELQRLDNPAQWKHLRLEFPSREAYSRCINALIARGAENITEDYASSHHSHDAFLVPENVSPKARSLHASESASSIKSKNQKPYPTNEFAATTGDISEMQSCLSPPVGSMDPRESSFMLRTSKGHLSRTNDSLREFGTPRSEVRSSRGSKGNHSLPSRNQPRNSQREMLTPHESCDSSKVLQSSHNERGLPVRSNPTNSRRELGTPSELRSLRSSAKESLREYSRGSGLPQHALKGSSVHEPAPRSANSPHNRGDAGLARQPNAVGQPPSFGRTTTLNNLDSPRSSKPAQLVSQPYDSVGQSPFQSPSETTMTQRLSRNRTQYQMFTRSVMKLMHHRLHFMQYLHKELVHEAYLVEEAKLLGGSGHRSYSASVNRSVSRPTSVSPRSPRRTVYSSVAEESARLREIEARLRSVERLQRDAEKDRKEALRLRQEAEKMESVLRDSGGVQSPNHTTFNVGDPAKYDASVRSYSPHTQSRNHPFHNDATSVLSAAPQGKPHASDASRVSPQFNPMKGNGQMALALHPGLYATQPTDEQALVEYSTVVLDRYIYGDEWHLLYPVRDEEVRFCALTDICLMLKLPRRLVTVTTISIDQPGMRITAEIHHNRDNMPREAIERRFASQPFLLLKRLYEMRHNFRVSANSSMSNRVGPRGSRGGSPTRMPQGYRSTSPFYLRHADNEIETRRSDSATTQDSRMDTNGRMRDLERMLQDRIYSHQQDRGSERGRKQRDLQREQLQDQLDQLERDEASRRSRLVLSEAEARLNANGDEGRDHQLQNHPHTVRQRTLEGEEQVERAKVEAGYARQVQAMAWAQRRNLALVRMLTQERERRLRITAQEREDRQVLDLMMHSQWLRAAASQPEVDEQPSRQRLMEAERKQRRHIYANLHSFLIEALQDEVEGLVGDERTVRMILAADEMRERLDIVCGSKAPASGGVPRALPVSPEAWQALFMEEVAERTHFVKDEGRRRRLFQREYIFTVEDVARNEIELKELDEHVLILEEIMHRNRAMLERRRQERRDVANLNNEEQYYRKGVLSEEHDEWEILMELFDSGLSDLLAEEAARLAAADAAPELESPQRRRRMTGSPRQTKPFHYMTFLPEDMDHPPSANLAIEGILGCSINKNLEVTSIERPLPKVEEDELQFQAGDMILDVAGYSLHSLSHLREVLANRTMQIQHEAREEFPDLPEKELTVNPALQKYLDVLCEHHNFLVQVLRGCEILQIIVK
ncbi:hypothetical protein TraAM80_08962 [Trypanosoma rangeli]|uniref:Flagellar attachment zone protein 1 conserved domain-containing protein n=1 Tax=Trypanosoma rangeli TaxID=5698 RepID=A0A3R7M8J2_TRYRA|nr:uncharacterized protein TraAM80_08962 [Trypanosoma rangeli]RNE98100.1 hypothetical protein TraAM80_08962 [Trypanosoma rangeli]|eukprot:RNE98100.1 hypothetical protein TraAM80_08962 [Trypanosoma rangeli]